MENSSMRPRAQHNRPQPTRRAVLKLAASTPLMAVPIAAAAVDVAPPATAAVPDEITGYYAFLVQEAASIEATFGLSRADRSALAAGSERAIAMQLGSTIRQRYDWLSGFTDTRSLFSVKEA